jgi:mannose-1-phosphate guanylyltransferase/phosphomannomutase
MKAAMLLCAGFGKRLKELTDDNPKPMLKVFGKPILEYAINHLSKLGIKNIFINLHYMADKISSYFKNGEKWNVNIKYCYEDYPLGTAGAVKNIENQLLKYENFFVFYGDIVTNENFNNLLNFHLSKNDSVATIIIHKRKKSNSIVKIDNENKVIEFIERPNSFNKYSENHWVNSGLYCFDKKILSYIPKNTICDFPKDIFPLLLKKGEIYGYPLKSYRCAIDSKERLEILQNDIKRKIFNF